jgi:hypothetical protein
MIESVLVAAKWWTMIPPPAASASAGSAAPDPVSVNVSPSKFSGPGVTIRDANGNERTVHVVGGIVELGGVYKVSTYSLSPDQQR